MWGWSSHAARAGAANQSASTGSAAKAAVWVRPGRIAKATPKASSGVPRRSIGVWERCKRSCDCAAVSHSSKLRRVMSMRVSERVIASRLRMA